jgi:hypothetical protein
MGLKLYGTMTSLGESGDGYGYSPGVLALVEYDFFKYAGFVVELGYGQSRFPMDEGEIRSDYLKTGLYMTARMDRTTGLVPYLAGGAYLKKALTSRYIDDYDGEEYDFKEYYSDYIWGIAAGAGLNFRLDGITWFAEVLGSRSMGDAVNDVNSNVVMLSRSPETEFQVSVGVKFHVLDGIKGSSNKLVLEKPESVNINRKKGNKNEK